jgi:hypothetical protein
MFSSNLPVRKKQCGTDHQSAPHFQTGTPPEIIYSAAQTDFTSV